LGIRSRVEVGLTWYGRCLLAAFSGLYHMALANNGMIPSLYNRACGFKVSMDPSVPMCCKVLIFVFGNEFHDLQTISVPAHYVTYCLQRLRIVLLPRPSRSTQFCSHQITFAHVNACVRPTPASQTSFCIREPPPVQIQHRLSPGLNIK